MSAKERPRQLKHWHKKRENKRNISVNCRINKIRFEKGDCVDPGVGGVREIFAPFERSLGRNEK